MSGTNFIKERTLAEKIIDKHLRRIAVIALEKGYNGLPFMNLEGEIFSGTERVGYVMLGSRAQFNVRISSDNEENKDSFPLFLADLGTTFSRYAKAILDDIEEKVRALPRVEHMTGLFNTDAIEGAARFLYNVVDSVDSASRTLGIMTRPGQVPVVGNLAGWDIRKLAEGNIVETARAVSNRESIAPLGDIPFHVLHSIFAIAPFMKNRGLLRAWRAYTKNGESPPAVFKQLAEAYARLKNCGTFEEAVRQRFGDISLLTKKQQEAFVGNTMKSLADMPTGKFDVYKGISLSLAGTGQENDNSYNPLVGLRSELRRGGKLTNVAPLVKKMIKITCGFGKDFYRNYYKMDDRYLKMDLRVPLPAALGGGEAEFGYPCSGFHLESRTISRLLTHAVGYGFFMDLLDGAANTPETLGKTTGAVIQGFARVVDALVEKMAAGHNAALVKIMNREVGKQKKEYAEKDWINKIASEITKGVKSCAGMIRDARAEGLIDQGEDEHLISLTIEGRGPVEIKFCIQDGIVEAYDGLKKKPVFKIPDYSASRSAVAEEITKFIGPNPESELSFLLKEQPSQLVNSLRQSFKEYVETSRAGFESRIEKEKETYYKAFQDDFAEDLFEEYCAGPAM